MRGDARRRGRHRHNGRVLEFLRGVGEHVGGWLYVIAGFLAFAEAAVMVGVVLPGEAALLVAGFAAHEHVISLVPMIVVAIVAAVVGDSVGYEVGRHAGPWLRSSRLGRFVGQHRWEVGEEFLRRHGGKAVLFGRCTALLRALMPGMAGMARMPYRTFLPWNAIGGVLWGGGCVLLGYVFAASLETVARYLSWGPASVVAVVVAVLVLREVIRRRRRRRRELTES